MTYFTFWTPGKVSLILKYIFMCILSWLIARNEFTYVSESLTDKSTLEVSLDTIRLQGLACYNHGDHDLWCHAGIILCMCPANERRRYNVTSLIGWVHTQNDLWPCRMTTPYWGNSTFQGIMNLLIIFSKKKTFEHLTFELFRRLVGGPSPCNTIKYDYHHVFSQQLITFLSRVASINHSLLLQTISIND